MNFLSRPAAAGSALFLASLAPVAAHPGHDDGHELTWDLGHLAAHPGATLICLAVLAGGVGAVVALSRRSQAAAPSELAGVAAEPGEIGGEDPADFPERRAQPDRTRRHQFQAPARLPQAADADPQSVAVQRGDGRAPG